ncbi:MAG: tyrosine-type recombinase/integrase [Eubacteriales bacterium]
MQQYLDSYKEMISLRGLTDHTKKSYATYINSYLNYLTTVLHKDPMDISWAELRQYIFWVQQQRSLSDRTINAVISQLRFFTIYVLHKSWDPYQLPSRKFDTFLPFVPTKDQVFTFISTLTDLKVKAMVVLLYSAGLRIGEVCHLKYQDIERKNMRIHITHGKNRSARYAVLSKQALTILTQYWFAYDKPMDWLFPKQFKESDKPIDSWYLSRHIFQHEEKLGWEHRFTCHSFRHAFGTHLYENGTDLLVIKSLLGHKSLSSTMIYVSLSTNGVGSALSPFDTLVGDRHV